MRNLTRILLAAVLIASLVPLASCGQSKNVTVPNVRGHNASEAYDMLHWVGLKVSIRQPMTYLRRAFEQDWSEMHPPVGFSPCVGLCASAVVTQIPRAGSSVARGSTVTLALSGSLILEFNKPRCYFQPEKAPRLVGKALGEARRYQPYCVDLDVQKIPPLQAGDQAHLFDNYIVSWQSPAPGAMFPPLSASNPSGTATLWVGIVAK